MWSCRGGEQRNIGVIFIPLTVIRVWVIVALKRNIFRLPEIQFCMTEFWNPSTYPSCLRRRCNETSCRFPSGGSALQTEKRTWNVKTSSSAILLKLAANGLQHVFEKWVERCKKCIACQGRYFKNRDSTHLHKMATRWVGYMCKFVIHATWVSKSCHPQDFIHCAQSGMSNRKSEVYAVVSWD
jgi:hypothetical protein